jgi:YHYH protein
MKTPFTLLAASLAIIATALEAPQVKIAEQNGKRIIHSNGIPDHETGQFPSQGNPNVISEQRHEFRMPLKPKPARQPVPANHAFFGVAVNGVPFEAGTAEFWNGDRAWNYEAKSGKINLGLDMNDAHVQPGGVYHYHGLPTGLITKLGGEDGTKMLLIGWAADGFPIYASYGHQNPKDATSPLIKVRSSYQLKNGKRPGGSRSPSGDHDGTFTADYEYVAASGDLDECNGRFGITPEYPQGIYHYHITAEFPHLSRLWRGEPDSSFMKRGGPPGGPGGPPRRGRKGGPGSGPPPGFGPPPPGFGPPP